MGSAGLTIAFHQNKIINLLRKFLHFTSTCEILIKDREMAVTKNQGDISIGY